MKPHPQPSYKWHAVTLITLVAAASPTSTANAQPTPELDAAALDSAVELSGLIPVLKAISLPTLYPRLAPQSLEFQRTFRCATQSDGQAYRSILRNHFAGVLTREELRDSMKFFKTPSWERFTAYRMQQTNFQLKQAPAPDITLDDAAEKLIEDFVESAAGSKFMLDSVVRSPSIGLQVYEAHGSTIQSCQTK